MELDFDYIKELTSSHEGVDVEYKETTGQLNRGMETLCGMLNGSGGIVVFGVTNTGKIIGQEIADKTTRDIGEALNKFDPAIDLQPVYISLPESEKKLIVFKSDGAGVNRPYMWDGKPFQRHDSVTTVMPLERLLRLHEQRVGLVYNWEKETTPGISHAEIDEELLMNVIHRAIRRGRLSQAAMGDNISTAIKRLQLVYDGKLSNAAAVLFGKNFYDYPQCKIRLARFKGNTHRDFIDNQQAEGNIFELVSAAMAFFFKHLNLTGTTHHRIERNDELEVPYDALRESVVNALCHRAWQNQASTIGIAIYDDRIEVENAGRFPANLSPSRLESEEENGEENTSMPPNPIIANVMFIGGLIEHWGRGLKMMTSECERVGLPAPKIFSNGYIVRITFNRPELDPRRQVEDKKETSRRQEGDKKKTGSAYDDIRENISPNIIKLIKTIGENWFSMNELLDSFGFKSRTTFLKNYISPSLEAGIVTLEDSDNPTSRNQRYGLTVKGKAIFYRI